MAEGLVDAEGDVPIFDWAFGSAYAISVYEYEGEELGREMWHVQCGSDNLARNERLESQVCIETPIAYGERPDSEFLDTVNLTRPKALEPGARYQILLSTMVEDDGPELESDSSGWLDFLEGPDQDDGSCGSGFSAEADFVAPGPGVPEEE